MNYYETLYIVHPALEAGRLKDIILGVEASLKKMGGKPLIVELWGKRKLSHYIDKQKYGTYVLLQYNGVGKCTGNFAVELEHNPNILAYLTTLIDQNDVIEQEEDLDTQIAGKTREVEKTELSKPKEEKLSSKDEKENKATEISDSEESKKKDSQDLEINEVKENQKEEQIDLSLKENGDEQTNTATAEQKTKGEENELEVDGTTGDEELHEKEEESKQENANVTATVRKEE